MEMETEIIMQMELMVQTELQLTQLLMFQELVQEVKDQVQEQVQESVPLINQELLKDQV